MICRKQSGHETDSQKIDRLSAQLQTMQSMLQELIYQKQDKKGSSVSQDIKRPISNIINHCKGDRKSKEAYKTEPDASRGIKAIGDIGGVVGGGANFGGFATAAIMANKTPKRNETSA